MTKFAFAAAVAVALSFSALGSNSASAGDFAIHFAGPGYHFDIGRAHGHHRHHGHKHFRHGWRGGHGWRGHHRLGGHAWHDTSHFDYHPGGLIPHYDHYHYIPGHWHFHQDGHWDHYHW